MLIVLVPLGLVLLGALQLLGWQRVRSGHLPSEDEENLRQLRRQIEESRSASFAFLLAVLLSVAGVVLLVMGDPLGVVLLVEALLLVVVFRQVQRLRPKALESLGDRGRQRRTDRYRRRVRVARGFAAVAAVGYASRFVLGAFVDGRASGGVEVARDVLNLASFAAIVVWLVVYAVIYISGDNLATPTEDEQADPDRA